MTEFHDETFEMPTQNEIQDAASEQFLTLSDADVAAYQSSIEDLQESYRRLIELADQTDSSGPVRDVEWERPADSANPHNAYVVTGEITGAPDGPLADYTIGIKDNTAVAGLPMYCGGSVFQDYIPEQDATLVERLLDAGATINGKLNMSDMGYDGAGVLTANGPIKNPRDDTHVAGGSSGGPAAAVVEGSVDAAIGGDQGGSIRIPASWCGCVGLKPTFGLVPYTRIVGMEPSNDHAGPLALTVRDCARILDVIAGPDGLDPRQHRGIRPAAYEDGLSGSVSGVSIGVIAEGFGHDRSDPRVDDAVWDALLEFEDECEKISETRVPLHDYGEAIFNGIEIEGMTSLLDDETIGRYLRGAYDTQRATEYGAARRDRADEYPPTLKRVLLLGQYLQSKYHGRFYAIAQNLRQDLTEAYDSVLEEYDVLALPTTPQTAHKYRSDLSLNELMEYTLNMTQNTTQYNVTGHPAISVPCGVVDGLPVGMTLVGQMFDDETVLKVAHAFEQFRDNEWDRPSETSGSRQ